MIPFVQRDNVTPFLLIISVPALLFLILLPNAGTVMSESYFSIHIFEWASWFYPATYLHIEWYSVLFIFAPGKLNASFWMYTNEISYSRYTYTALNKIRVSWSIYHWQNLFGGSTHGIIESRISMIPVDRSDKLCSGGVFALGNCHPWEAIASYIAWSWFWIWRWCWSLAEIASL